MKEIFDIIKDFIAAILLFAFMFSLFYILPILGELMGEK